MLILHWFFLAIGTQGACPTPDIDARFVNRISQRIASVPEYNQSSSLRHEHAHVADIAVYDDFGAFEGNAATRSGISVDNEKPPVRGCTRRLAGVARNSNGTGHHVLGHALPSVALDQNIGELVHSGAVVADVTGNLYGMGRVQSARQGMHAVRIEDAKVPAFFGSVARLQRGIGLRERRFGHVDDMRVGIHINHQRAPQL